MNNKSKVVNMFNKKKDNNINNKIYVTNYKFNFNFKELIVFNE